jgi:L-asparaginase II
MERITVVSLRGGHEEARHHVHAIAVSNGAIVASCGDPELVTFFRSSAKPIQALPLVRARPDLDDAEIAIACASHLHRPDQLDPVRRLLDEAAATEDDLECGPEPTRLEHNCSGKHAAMLLLCRVNGWPDRGPALAAHPCQQAMLAEVASAAEVVPETMPTGIDGCGVVTFALTLERMAHAFSRLRRSTAARAPGTRCALPGLIRGTAPRTPSSCVSATAGGEGAEPKGSSAPPATGSASRSRSRTARNVRSPPRSPCSSSSSGSRRATWRTNRS